jgi:hypothetical protein
VAKRSTKFDWETARAMHRDGDSYADLARFFGVTAPGIRAAIVELDYRDTGEWHGAPSQHPDQRKRRQSARREPKDKPADGGGRLVVMPPGRGFGAPIAYSLVRRLAQVLDQLARDGDVETRRRSRAALVHAYAIEDQLTAGHGRPADRAAR